MPIHLGTLARVPQDILALHAAVDPIPTAVVTIHLLQGSVATRPLQRSIAIHLLQRSVGITQGTFLLLVFCSTLLLEERCLTHLF